MAQAETTMGFYYDETACIGCRTCQIACKDKNDLPVGVLFRKVESFESGHFPHASIYHLASTCNNCANPACVEQCPTAATFIDADGTVQHDDSRCIGCRACVIACPYQHPVFLEDLKVVHRCNTCQDLRVKGEDPACASSCPMRALQFGPINELRAAHPEAVQKIAPMPSESLTDPSIAIDARDVALGEDFKPLIM
ncbi:4Fe-4S dicluster domain-containing protein [uncultured Senegalimassilia sp.]|uniref:4Fe-4S dicluster domain-containing protein n=1 Tax=uncultured Senegalimassilia sp. TaxID=1714350 RepID=UPI0025D32F52|nr:4Fe-4S dicluster domain-containing protein [uncultured Senegalimassilia sp.]